MSLTKSSDISYLIRTLRQRLELSQVQFAKQLGVSFKTVNSWENRRNRPSQMAMILIQEKLKAMGENGIDLLEKYF